MLEPTANLSMPTPKTFNWKIFWLLFGLNIVGLIVMTPLVLSLGSSAASLQEIDGSILFGITFTQVGNALIYGLFIGVGLLLATRSGLSAPILLSWITKKPEHEGFKSALKAAITVGIVLPVFNLLMIVTTRFLESKTVDFGFFPGSTGIAPRWHLFLGGIGAGITEEILFRLFLFSLFFWLGSRVVPLQKPHSKAIVFWIANILSALIFGLYHLSTARLDVPMSVIRSIGLNSMGGLAFGWLYRNKGLESAMISHATADIFFYIIAPYFISF